MYSRAYGSIAGGIEKMSLDLANGLARKGHQVTIASLDPPGSESFFVWPSNVEWIQLGIGNPESKNSIAIKLKRVIALRKVAKQQKFDVAVGFQIGSYFLMRVSLIGISIRVIAAERNAPTLFNFIIHGKRKRFFSNFFLLFATRIAVQFEDYRLMYPQWLRSKIVVTPNWVKQNPIRSKNLANSTIRILYVGRLTFQKNVKVLIDALGLLPENFTLTVVGTGSDLEELKLRSKKLGNRVSFREPSTNLYEIYPQFDLFCLPSRWEGFPNVLAEAIASGLPVVGFEDCSGIPQLIVENLNGCLATGMDNPDTLRAALLKASAIQFNSVEIARSVERYTFENYIQNWERALS
jgi:GalNAc-alpha-(1->4)-GalNAc-alpha-(1->3)-diNAcBac-PP-undecaprenol alpha-1,4-N-acetyl-D-galactosaminyltransferase